MITKLTPDVFKPGDVLWMVHSKDAEDYCYLWNDNGIIRWIDDSWLEDRREREEVFDGINHAHWWGDETFIGIKIGEGVSENKRATKIVRLFEGL